MKATALAIVAGYVDGYALRVFGLFVSFMSGNTTIAGTEAGQGQFFTALAPALAIAGFVGGSFIGNWYAHSGLRYAQRLLWFMAAALIACFIVLNVHTFRNANLSLPMLSVAMGMMNPTVTSVGSEPVSLTFVTGTLNKVGDHLALAARHMQPTDAAAPWDTQFYRAALETSVWVAFLLGATMSGLLTRYFGVIELAPAAVALALLALTGQPGESHTNPTVI